MDIKNIKKVLFPFFVMLFFNSIYGYLLYFADYASGYNPHVGILFISGLLFGPYGALGSTLANLFFYIYEGMDLTFLVMSSICNFAVAYLGYKLWYAKFRGRTFITKPGFYNVNMVLLFFACILITGLVYSVIHLRLFYLFEPNFMVLNNVAGLSIFVKFINSSVLFGLVGMVLAKRFDFIHVPKLSKRKLRPQLYHIVFGLLIAAALIVGVWDLIHVVDGAILIVPVAILLLIYLTKPFNTEIVEMKPTITEKIMNFYVAITIILVIFLIFWYSDETVVPFVISLVPFDPNDLPVIVLWALDEVMVPFTLSSLVVLAYIEYNLINPIVKFSRIDRFIGTDKRIQSQGLLEMYSKYIDENDEVGALARGYSQLLVSNEEYIENIDRIEREKERIQTELDVARRIQEANLPTESIKNDDFVVKGSSRPAKEVGGDFFDYYQIDDDNLALVIGDASGKGIPAALLALITQTLVKQLLQHEINPSRALYLLNNQLYEHNSETMFITLWLGIYNRKTNLLKFSNAGHNPPLVRQDGKYSMLNEESGFVLGIVEDYEFTDEQINLKDNLVIYTDGITEAVNDYKERYGGDRLIRFFNGSENIDELYSEIDEFCQSQEQFDDMTVLILKKFN